MTRVGDNGYNPHCKTVTILAVLVISTLEIYYVSKLERGYARQPYLTRLRISMGDYKVEMTANSDTELISPELQQHGEESTQSNPRVSAVNGTMKPPHTQLNVSFPTHL